MFDYIVIGGGSAGSVLAGRLSEDPQVAVCLLEAGPDDTHPLIHCPAGIALLAQTMHGNWGFQTTPQAGLNGRRGYQPRGKVLGGSSSVNAMIYTRGHRASRAEHRFKGELCLLKAALTEGLWHHIGEEPVGNQRGF